MTHSISHGRDEETIEAKARWFATLTYEQRAEVLCDFVDLVLAVNPGVAEVGRAQSSSSGIRVLSLP